MYKNKKRVMKNGYVVVEFPEHPRAFDTGTGIVGVYEHVLIAEEDVIDRPLKTSEVVHHLDQNRSNNSPENLLVLSNPMHGKLHSWLDKNEVKPKEDYGVRKELGCIRCSLCERPINHGETYCSTKCASESRRKLPDISKEELEKLVWETPTSKLAERFNVSDKAVEKLCLKLNVSKPPRGYWAKTKSTTS